MAVVTASDGRLWTVRRRWDPRPSRRSRSDGGWFDAAVAAVDVPGVGIIALVVVLIGAVLAAVEIVAAAVVAFAGFSGRSLAKRPWLVEAHASGGETLRWEVVGWRASGRHVRHVVDQLRDGLPLPEGAVA